MNWRLGLALVAGSTLTVIPSFASAQNWIVDLGSLTGASSGSSDAYAISNDARQVVGSSVNGGGQLQAFVANIDATYRSSTMTALGTLAGGNASEARAINLSGTIAGFSRISNSEASERAVTWNGLVPTQLSTFDSAAQSRAYSISNTGSTVGWIVQGGQRKAFYHNGASMSLLNLDPDVFDMSAFGFSEALGISPDGRYIVGRATSNTLGEVHGFIYDTTDNSTTDIVSSANTTVNAVHNNFSAGTVNDGIGGSLAFVYTNATGGSNGSYGSHGGTVTGNGLNKYGMVVGTEFADTSGTTPQNAFWGDGTSLYDLNDYAFDTPLTGTLLTANAISDLYFDSHIVGTASYGGGTSKRAYLMVPEPASMAAILLGISALGARRRKPQAK